MSQIWIDVDAALTEVPVNIQSLIDDTDFKTREESVTFNQAGMDLVWNFVTTAGVFTQTAVIPTSGGDYDWVNQGNGMYSIEIPASGGASINNDTEGFGWFTGFATGILPWRGPIIGFRASGLNDKLIDSAYSVPLGLAGTALPAAAANAAGGLPISAAGGLALDTKLANTNEITVARMGALTDWINGGRLDLILDIIAGDVENIDGDAMRGTDSAALAATALSDVTWTAAAAQALLDWVNGGRLDLILDIIAGDVVNIDGDAMRGTNNANIVVPDAAGVAPTAIEVRDSILDDAIRFSGANVDASISSRSSHTAANVWAVGARTLTSFGTLVADVWATLTSGLTTAGSIGKKLADWILGSDSKVLLSTDAQAGVTIPTVTDVGTCAVNADMRGTDNAALAVDTALEATLTAMKGAGWTTETLKAIFDALPSGGGDATLANQSDMIDKLKGLMSKAYTLLSAVGTFDPALHSNEATRERGDSAWLTGGGVGGSSTITLTILDQDSNPIPDASVQIWNSLLSSVISFIDSNSNGVATLTADDGNYLVKVRKGGYSFAATTSLVVAGNTSASISGTSTIPADPAGNQSCRVYDYLFKQDGVTPVDSVDNAIAKIISLPSNVGGVLNTDDPLDGVYDSATGLLYWDVVRTSTAKFIIKDFGIKVVKTVPDQSTVRLSDMV